MKIRVLKLESDLLGKTTLMEDMNIHVKRLEEHRIAAEIESLPVTKEDI